MLAEGQNVKLSRDSENDTDFYLSLILIDLIKVK